MKETSSGIHIYCLNRKSYYLLTPEEWVRQHWLHFLVDEKKVPLNSIVIEHPIEINKQVKRADILVYKNQKPHILVECKASHIKLNDSHLDQISVYNRYVNANYLVLSNGMVHRYLIKNKEAYLQIESISVYNKK